MKADDPKLTAFALDALGTDERSAVQHALAENPALERELQAIEQFSSRMKRAFTAGSTAELSETQWSEITEAAHPSTPTNVISLHRPSWRTSWLVPAAAGLAIGAVIAALTLSLRQPVNEPTRAVSVRPATAPVVATNQDEQVDDPIKQTAPSPNAVPSTPARLARQTSPFNLPVQTLAPSTTAPQPEPGTEQAIAAAAPPQPNEPEASPASDPAAVSPQPEAPESDAVAVATSPQPSRPLILPRATIAPSIPAQPVPAPYSAPAATVAATNPPPRTEPTRPSQPASVASIPTPATRPALPSRPATLPSNPTAGPSIATASPKIITLADLPDDFVPAPGMSPIVDRDIQTIPLLSLDSEELWLAVTPYNAQTILGTVTGNFDVIEVLSLEPASFNSAGASLMSGTSFQHSTLSLDGKVINLTPTPPAP